LWGGTAVAVIVGYFYICQLAFRKHLWLPYASPIVTFLLTYLIALGYRLFVADRDREKIKNTWSRYMSPKLVDLLMEGSNGCPPRETGKSRFSFRIWPNSRLCPNSFPHRNWWRC
jgi:hypothetical protein